MTEQSKLRSVAIIAHVDHGKTTLVDQLFKQSGMYHEDQVVQERLMDSMDLERERGITIQSKNGSCNYKDYRINIIDTPGHADFGGEVERVLSMADGALFLVDAAEGPMPQSLFVLKKAIRHNIPIIVVVNKIDKPAARPEWVIDQVFDLLVKLEAPDSVLDFSILYSSAKNGYASTDQEARSGNMIPIFDMIIDKIPAPSTDVNGPLQMMVTSMSYSPFLGRLAIGKLTSGSLKQNQEIVMTKGDEILAKSRATKIYHYKGNQQVETDSAIAGDIVAVSGLEDIRVGYTITDPKNPIGLPPIEIDPPTISMTFLPNSSPFSGQEGEFVTGRQVRDRLMKETLSDVALTVDDMGDEAGYKVAGRGELHLSILIEKMRREGYEFQVSRPKVIFKEENGQRMEPFEELTIEVDESFMGKVIEQMGSRKGIMLDMVQNGALTRLIFKVPTRGLLGYQSEFLMATKGMGVMNYVFSEYGPYAGDIKTRKNGVIISKEACQTVAYGLCNIQERGVLFMGAGENVYAGQIIGMNAKEDDLIVNPGKSKKLTNMRASGSDEDISLTPPLKMSLEQYITFISDGELVELTPKSIRLRKIA